MTDAPPPTFELEAPPLPKRNYIGWAFIAIILGFLFIMELSSYLGRDSKTGAQFGHVQTEFEAQVRYREALQSLGSALPSSGHEYEKLAAGLKPHLKESKRAAMLYAAMRFEEGQQSSAKDLEVLSKGNAEQLAFQTIYSKQVLLLGDLPNLRKALNQAKFMDRLALAHALQKAGQPNPRKALFTDSQKKSLLAAIAGIITALILGLFALLLMMVGSIGKSFPGHPTGAIGLFEADALAVRAASLLAAYLGVSIVAEVLLRHASTPVRLIASGIVLIGVSLLLCKKPILRRLTDKDSGLAELGVRRPTLRLIGWGALGALANAPIVLTMAVVGQFVFRSLPPAEHPIEEMLHSPSPLMLVAIFFAASVQAPIFEEMLFRGSMLPAMARVFKSPMLAGVVSSLLFAMIHPTGIPAWPALAAVGGMSAFLTYRTGSLVPSMTMHCLHNAATLAFALAIG